MQFFSLLAVLLFVSYSTTKGQDIDKRHRFARSYFGPQMNYHFALPDAPYLDATEQLQYYRRNDFFIPALNLGATSGDVSISLYRLLSTH
jgi:hypothetical protein